MLDDLSKQIAELSYTLFPNATLESQLLKLEEEIEEADLSVGVEYLKELVDIFIVASTLAIRFESHVGKHTLDVINERVKGNKNFVYYVEEKIEINKNRTWHEIEEGVYHH